MGLFLAQLGRQVHGTLSPASNTAVALCRFSGEVHMPRGAISGDHVYSLVVLPSSRKECLTCECPAFLYSLHSPFIMKAPRVDCMVRDVRPPPRQARVYSS